MALMNCTQCTKLFQNPLSRALCPECFGQKIFGKKATDSVEDHVPEPVLAPRIIDPEHALRCEIKAKEGRAHRGSTRWGQAKFW